MSVPIEKIRKLLKLAESPNINEAAAAAARAQEIMERHRISQAMLDIDEPEEPVSSFGLTDSSGRIPSWRGSLAVVVAQSNGCMAYIEAVDGKKRRLAVIGRQGDADAAKYLFSYFCAEIERLAAASEGQGRSYLTAFRYGAASVIGQRLKEGQNTARVDCDAKALVKLESVDASVLAFARNLGLKKRSSRRIGGSARGYHDGREAGRSVSLGGTHTALGGERRQLR